MASTRLTARKRAIQVEQGRETAETRADTLQGELQGELQAEREARLADDAARRACGVLARLMAAWRAE